MEHEKKFPLDAKDYKLYEEVGEGVSATVYRALCIPLNEIVAIKVLDLEKCNNDLDGIRREVQTMSLIDHPNLLQAHCSFTSGHTLWVVMPYMAGGSCLHIMKSEYPEGFDEPVIATLLREVLKALVYLHNHGHIHRDVKAGNILIDSNGAVKLADFGVSACMFDAGDRQRSRNTFVGTPCWMAPEVMQQLHGYDFKADIWSFGITALELAHGHAPFSKYPPMKVLLMTLQNAPPGLDYERDKKFSKSFKEMVATCLVKDPKKRPTSEKLFKHSFFKHARSNEYLARTILEGLTPLGDRFRTLKAKEADLLVQNRALYGDKEQLSQQEYIRGISAWNFNLEDLKNQAALIQDYDVISNVEDPDGSNAALSHEDGFNDLSNLENSLASFPVQPLQALKGYFDVCEDDGNASSLSWRDVMQSESEEQSVDQEAEKDDGENFGRSSSLPRQIIPGHKNFLAVHCYRIMLSLLKKLMVMGTVEDTPEGAVVQCKGRFKVTSAEGPTNCFFSQVSGGSTSPTTPSLTAASILPSLQFVLQQNTMQREEIMKLIKYVEQSCGNHIEEAGSIDLSQMALPQLALEGWQEIHAVSTREKELQSQVIHLQQSIGTLVEELQRQKLKNAQMYPIPIVVNS
ncbi:Serine/threonine-protein kinase fray2 [Vitis vinifera]|uniref:Serine/threonine-protein kinase fray2 n=1 Tax=Vitis vinifera TaxID=29760 RepID=A0A438EFY5_VITVI|nr:Serine/threonine-protein kinase fray2 [Vitis vinifera]